MQNICGYLCKREKVGCRNYEDAYTDPGSPMSRKTKWNTYVLAQLDDQQKLLLEGLSSSYVQSKAEKMYGDCACDSHGSKVCTLRRPSAGTGATPEGNKPFVDIMELSSGEKQRIWQSQAPYYESPGMLLNDMDPSKPIR